MNNFFSCDGFVGPVGIPWILMIVNLIAAIFLFRWGTKINTKIKEVNDLLESEGKNLCLISTIISGSLGFLALAFGVVSVWFAAWGAWTFVLVISSIFNLWDTA